MDCLKTPATNVTLVAPGCDDLPCVRQVHQTDIGPMSTITSYWRPTVEELAALNAGLPLVLSFMGSTHPPIMVRVGDDS
jgi:hypothetical protein